MEYAASERKRSTRSVAPRSRRPIGGAPAQVKVPVWGLVVIALLLAGFGGGWYLLSDFGMPEPREPAPTMKGSIPGVAQPKVRDVCNVWCPYCAKTRAFFKKHGIAYTSTTSSDEDARDSEYKAMGGRGVPFYPHRKRQSPRV
jgi:glutaredoxin